ncbi:MAG: PQQ-dependent sugar dehydrogenase [Chloroflexi bacterium]|nr:PQQ-dependent sugar dehydrogenase [Chloroflexota bacterium]
MRPSRATLRPVVALAAAIMLAACGSPGPTPLASVPVRPTAMPGATGSAEPSPTAVPGSPVPTATPAAGWEPPALALAPVADGLEAPLFVGSAGDGSGRLFIVEQGGRIRTIRDGRLLAEPFLDIAARISTGGERGLLGLAFSPTFADDGRFFVNYTDAAGDTVVAEYRVSAADPDRADLASGRLVLAIDQPYANHNGGDLAFGPDGLLWIGTGDGGSGGDPEGRAQRLDSLLGKLLRIDPDPRDGAPYAVPADNPFLGRDDARPEIWASGLRNPWRYSFDRATGDLWIGDVGQAAWEEIDVLRAGTLGRPNLGWNVMEGSHCFEPAEGCSTAGLVPPVAEYGRDAGCSVTGGYVYRGEAIAGLAGTYLFGDFCSGTIWGLEAAADRPAARVLLQTEMAIASFGEDEAGELYVSDLGGGRVFRLTAAE